ncbi:MAG TPA: phage/plasmid primase, P4 family, partial [Candidatus Binatus sp.]|nr:phage/plasmid primase, P4 family [Candidatus Binatus sp.]
MTDFLTDDEAAAYAEATQPDDATILPAPSDPIAVARTLVAALFTFGGLLSLRHWRGGWWLWLGSHWAEVEERRLRRDAYLYTENAAYINRAGAWQPWAPTSSKISGVLDATAAVAHLDAGVDQPAWIGDGGPPVVATANGLLDMGRRVLLPHTPEYFNQTAVPCGYDPAAPVPSGWLAFLSKLWPDDPDSIAVLQEWFGYVIGGRSDQHKILLLVGPTRGGKGVITRILGRLVGSRNVAGPTMASLGTPFGLAPLVGRVLAVISDARLDASRDASVIVERLLAISGEDTITVDIKYHEQWTGKLPTRFVVVSNELPRLGDASGTIANRFVALLLHESWLGREDHGLESALAEELPGILNWALEGLDRLAAQGRFTRPASTDEAIIAIQDLASPVAAFVREQCIVGPYEVAVQAIF